MDPRPGEVGLGGCLICDELLIRIFNVHVVKSNAKGDVVCAQVGLQNSPI